MFDPEQALLEWPRHLEKRNNLFTEVLKDKPLMELWAFYADLDMNGFRENAMEDPEWCDAVAGISLQTLNFVYMQAFLAGLMAGKSGML